jgi:type II secretory pathway component PulK
MSPREILVLCLLLVVAMSSSTVLTAVDAARRLAAPEEHYSSATAHASMQLHERARSLIATWMAQLTSGPSPKGPGH